MVLRKPDAWGKDAEYDLLVVGAGLTGINAAYRLQTAFPKLNYAILESRQVMGGTWSFFKYPGVRSDSDMYTYGYEWRRWDKGNEIAEGHLIHEYIEESAKAVGIDKKVLYQHKVVSLAWTDQNCQWRLQVDTPGGLKSMTARFLISAMGYYDYKHPLPANLPGVENFKGQIIHPQFWPMELDYANKRIAIIGSGSTAVTLLPHLAKTAKKVTLIQRSPSYIVSLPSSSLYTRFCLSLPNWMAHRLIRWKFILVHALTFAFFRSWPSIGRSYLCGEVKKQLPSRIPPDPHFNPRYNVWDQRLCIIPDGDFFQAFRDGKADIVTDTIKQLNEDGIVTKSGDVVTADIIVTATGLKIRMLGGSQLSVNGTEINIGEKFYWRGMMIEDVPNAAVILGYTNTSFTLGTDLTINTFIKLMKYMEKRDLESVKAQVPKGIKMKAVPWTLFTSTYFEMGKNLIPFCGDRGNWLPRRNYLFDYWREAYQSLTDGLVFKTSPRVKGLKSLKAMQ